MVPELLDLAEQAKQRQGGAAYASANHAASGAVGALAQAGSGVPPGSMLPRSASGTPLEHAGVGSVAATGMPGGGQEAGEEGEEEAAEDVHQQALARVSSVGLALPRAAAGAGEEGKDAAEAGQGTAGGEKEAGDGQAQQEAEPEAETAPADLSVEQQQPSAAPPAARKPRRPPRGALLGAFSAVVRDLYLAPTGSGPAVSAAPLLRTLREFPIAGEFRPPHLSALAKSCTFVFRLTLGNLCVLRAQLAIPQCCCCLLTHTMLLVASGQRRYPLSELHSCDLPALPLPLS